MIIGLFNTLIELKIWKFYNKELQIAIDELNDLHTSRRDINTTDFAEGSLTVIDDLCIDFFSANKSIFTENFHVNRLDINDDLLAKEDNISPYFEVIHD